MTAESPGLRPRWLANDQRSGLRSVHLLRLARRRRTYAWGWVGLGFPKQVDTTDNSNDRHFCRGRNQHPPHEFPHHLLLIRGSSDPPAGERLEIREIWRPLMLCQYVLDLRQDQCFRDVSTVFLYQLTPHGGRNCRPRRNTPPLDPEGSPGRRKSGLKHPPGRQAGAIPASLNRVKRAVRSSTSPRSWAPPTLTRPYSTGSSEYGTAIGMVPINDILSVQMPRVLPPSMRYSAPVR